MQEEQKDTQKVSVWNKFKKRNKKNGSLCVTMTQLFEMFFRSRFNRDNMHDPAPGEDINDSLKHRLYNRRDLVELAPLFSDFFQWAITDMDVGRIRFTKDISLVRETIYPRVKLATSYEETLPNVNCVAGEYYVTAGKYKWYLQINGDTFVTMHEKSARDPEIQALRKELLPVAEEKNAERKRNKEAANMAKDKGNTKNTDESSK